MLSGVQLWFSMANLRGPKTDYISNITNTWVTVTVLFENITEGCKNKSSSEQNWYFLSVYCKLLGV